MTEKNTPDTDECQNISYHRPHWDENGKCSWVDIQLQHKSLNAKARCILPPIKAIPVIFIPGVMGTNLKNKKDDQPVWRADWYKGMDTLPFIGLNGQERRELLNVKTTAVDDQGKIQSSKYTLYSDDGNLFPSREQRHWGEALHLSYGDFLDIFQTSLVDDWQRDIHRMTNPEFVEKVEKVLPVRGILSELLALSNKDDDSYKTDFTEKELNHFKHFLFPVHVFGYNWLVDNAISAAQLVKYIDKVINTYKYQHGHGLAVEKVILVTHSMGGLVARYASQVLGVKDKILGIVHGVMPDTGSPAAYRRMKTGAGKEGVPGMVLGDTAEKLMPVLAFAPGPLQLLPSPKYPSNWLKFEGGESYPKVDPFEEIYLRDDVWWRLYEPDILDKDQVTIRRNEKSYTELMRDTVKIFMIDIEKGEYHPNTYVFYGKEVKSDGFLTWVKENKKYQNPYTGQPITPQYTTHDRKIVKLPDCKYCEYLLTQSNTAGDGTVPVESLNEIKKYPLLKGWLATNVDHQDAYEISGPYPDKYSEAIKFTLQSIIKIVQEVDVHAAN